LIVKTEPKLIGARNCATGAADFIRAQAQHALGERNEVRIALSGGNTPRPVYTLLAAIGRDLPWDLIRITFGDERCVPPDDAESNFGMAWETLLALAEGPARTLLRLRGALDLHT